jgi:hypothetical protein
MQRSDFFVTGGALLADAGSYVARAADASLLTALRAGEFCYVLTTRQMGKTSLTVRTAAQLREGGGAVVVLDLTAFGQNLDVEQWYFSMLSDMACKLDLENEMEGYWEENARRAPLHRFMGAIREVYLEKRRKPLTIFVDEIDVVRSLQQFKADEFFAGIRECYNRRSEDPRLQRLTFCLLGVATPSDLISDQRMTPFNIGRGIELADFTREEATVLAAGLSPYRETALTLLDRVLNWTGGHPYLTQRMCAEVAKAGLHSAADVDAVCTNLFLSPDAQNRDENLQFVRERILRGGTDPAAVLDTYARICRREKVEHEDHNAVHDELRLSGIVRVADGCLLPRNRIYSKVFDLKWVRTNLPEPETLRQRAAFLRGVRRVAGAAVAVLLVVGGFAFSAKRSADEATEAGKKAQAAADGEKRAFARETKAADDAKKAAEREMQAAARAREAAEAAQLAAERERKANEERLAQAEQTEHTLNRLVATQSKVATLLEALTPLVGQKMGKDILDRAEEVVRELASTPGDDSRIRIGLADLSRVCGRLYLRLGDAGKALQQAEAARQIVRSELAPSLRPQPPASEAAQRKPNRDSLKQLLFECHLLVGDVLLGGRPQDNTVRRAPAGYEGAMKVYEEAAQLAREESTTQPQEAKWRQLYFSSLMNLADTAWLCSHGEDAQKRYSDAVAELQKLRAKLPNVAELGWIEASFHDRLGTLHLNSERMEKAREQFDLALQLREAGASEGTREDPERASDMAQSFNKLGNLALTGEDWKAAVTYYQRSLAIRRKLCELSPRLDWARNLGFSLANVAQALWKNNQTKEALQHYAERLKLADVLLARDPTDANLRADYANALLGNADILLNAKGATPQDWEKALDMARYAVTRTERRDPRLLLLLAQALRLNKLPAESLAVAEEAAKLLPPTDKRTKADEETADEIAFELERSKSAKALPHKSGAKKRR